MLLKNDRNTLPLRKDLGTIAVIGPNADQWRMLLGNYNGIPKEPITPLRGIRDARWRTARACSTRSGSDLAEGFPVLEHRAVDRAAHAGWAARVFARSTSPAAR